MYNSTIDYWSNTPTDQPWLLNGFKGTWAFSDHSLIPEILQEFLIEYFYKQLGEERKRHIYNISLDKINDVMNEVWEGPGSMKKVVEMTYNMRQNRLNGIDFEKNDPLKGYDTPTFESNLGENVVDSLEK